MTDTLDSIATDTPTTASSVGLRRILLVDNRQGWVDLESEILSGLDNVEITTATSAQEAIEYLKDGSYDLVLSDLHMHEGHHGDEVITYALETSAKVGIISGTVAGKYRPRFLSLEPGLILIRKSQLDDDPAFVRRVVNDFLSHDRSYLRDDEGIRQLVLEAAKLDDVNAIYHEIDALMPAIRSLTNAIGSSKICTDRQRDILGLINPKTDDLGDLVAIKDFYQTDPQDSYTAVHDYKSQFTRAVDIVKGLSQEDPDLVGLYRRMHMLNTRIISALESAEAKEQLSIQQIWNREIHRLQTLYPDVNFDLDPSFVGDTVGRDPNHFYLDSKFRESLRVLLSNAAEAYDGTTGNKYVGVSLSQNPGSGLNLTITNRGSPIPEDLVGTLSRGKKVTTTKLDGSGMGLGIAVELGEELGYTINFSSRMGETTAKLELSADAYSYKMVEPGTPQGGRVLFADHDGLNMHIADSSFDYNLDYITRDGELGAIANDPEQANAYFCLVLHARSDDIELAHRMRELNPDLQLVFSSGASLVRKELTDRFPEATVHNHLAESTLTRLFPEAKLAYDSTHV
jgi:CheY-like chemotaxis protein